jgi:hypothetical protein
MKGMIMTNEQKQIAQLAIAGVVSVGVLYVIGKRAQKLEIERQKRWNRYAENWNAYLQNLITLDECLDRQLETAKFWEIVTRD